MLMNISRIYIIDNQKSSPHSYGCVNKRCCFLVLYSDFCPSRRQDVCAFQYKIINWAKNCILLIWGKFRNIRVDKFISIWIFFSNFNLYSQHFLLLNTFYGANMKWNLVGKLQIARSIKLYDAAGIVVVESESRARFFKNGSSLLGMRDLFVFNIHNIHNK